VTGENLEFFTPGLCGYERIAAPATKTPVAGKLKRFNGHADDMDEADVERMVDLLQRVSGWMAADTLAASLALGHGESGKRRVRALASVADGRVISGQAGYKATSSATLEEIAHAVAWLRSQAYEMSHRADQIERYRSELCQG